jgi:diguanylate cyclase (GGDEF)-like protein/PAS domain S-box-containing protein
VADTRRWTILAVIAGVAAVSVAVWMSAFPPESFRDWIDIAQEASFFAGAAIALPALLLFGDRVLTAGWLLFTASLLFEVCDEFTAEPRFWGETFTFALGATGLLLAGVGFWRVTRRRQRDVMQREKVVGDLEQSHNTLQAVLEGTPDHVSVRDLSGRYLLVNPAGAAAAGRAAAEMIGHTNAELFGEQGSRVLSDNDLRVLESGETVTYEEVGPGEGGAQTYLVTKGVYRDKRGFALGILRIARDITERKAAEAQLAHDSLHDVLTGLPNRARFLDELAVAMSRVRRRPSHLFAVLFLDLDRFKVINDSLGHAAGDELLAIFARTLKGWLRPSDLVARLGGDEFTVLLDGMDSADDATRVAERIESGLRGSLRLGDREVFASVSIGIALSTSGYERAEDVLRDADLALYRAKAAGRGRYAIFDVEMHARAMAHLQLETDLRRAVERQEFRIAYQPIIALGTRKLLGFEALLRWQHPTRGLIAPGEFLEVADETGLMVPIGRWCLKEACTQLARWQEEREEASVLTMSCNVSSRQLMHPQLVQYVKEALQAANLDPARLRIEITESVIMEHAEAAASRLRELRDLGVQLDMDDFGTGYSSLSYLQRFPLHAVKIDRSFIERMRGGQNAEIVRAILTLGRNLGLDVIAEGVETGEQDALLVEMGCPCAQGFLFSHPVAAEQAARLIAEAAALR